MSVMVHLSPPKLNLSVKHLLPLLPLAVSTNAFSLSLEEAVNAQLALGPLPCAELLSGYADNTDRFSGGLLDICSAAVPAGTVSNSSGGNSAVATTTPAVMSNVVKNIHAGKNSSDEAITTKINPDWSLFFTAEAEALDKEETDFSGAYDSDSFRVLAGVTYSANPAAVYSFAFDSTRQDGDYNSGGNFEHNSYGARLLASFRPTDQWFVSALTSVSSISADYQREGHFSFDFNHASVFSTTGTPAADYEYDLYGINLETGYEYQTGRYTFSPSIGLQWQKTDYGTYSETGNSGLELTFYDRKQMSLQTTLGLTTTASFSTSFGAVNPQLGLAWHHELKDQSNGEISFIGDSFNERFQYETDELDSNFLTISAGAVFVLKQGLQGFVNVQTMAGHDYYDSVIANLGFRLEL
jgi:uncharacterized protein YhjY with autotransporter beta-barrel domain